MAEFDQYADGYNAGLEHPLKRLVGRSAEEFVAVKVRWLLRDLQRHPLGGRGAPMRPHRILDDGCGAGVFLQLLAKAGWSGELHGCDPSPRMLEETRRRWDAAPAPKLDVVAGDALPYASESFDLVVVCCVAHHVAPESRNELFREAARVLASPGRLYVFEHNPRNPVTRWVVSQTPIDRHARLVSPVQVSAELAAAGLEQVRTRYLMFLPPRWHAVRWVEDWLSWCLWGAQYVVCGTKTGVDRSLAHCNPKREREGRPPLACASGYCRRC